MVTKPALIDDLTGSRSVELTDLFEFFPTPPGEVVVNARLLYPDREEVQVWVSERDGEYVVTDRGGGHDWLRRSRCFRDLTAEQLALIDEVRRSLVLEGEGVELVARVPAVENIPYAILDVALAAVRVADISYTCHPGGGLVGQPRTKPNKPDQT